MIIQRFARSIACLGLGAAVAGAAQDSFELYRPLQTEAARFERETRVRDLYAEASEDAREGVLQLYEADRAADHVARLPELSTLTAAERVLGTGDSGVGPDLDAGFLAALDLRVVPGFFAVRDGGNGEAITVHLSMLYQAPVPRELVIGLDWVAPDGSRFRARTEAFEGREFGDGLAMFIRPPVSEAAIWRIAPSLLVGDNELHGYGVPVPCIADVEATRKQLQAGGEGSRTDPHRALWRDWNHLHDFGVRSTSAASLPERLGHYGLPGGSDWSHDFAWISFGAESSVGAWGFAPEGKSQAAVLILSDGRRSESAVFAGALEARWKRFADDHECFVLSLLYSGEEADQVRLDAVIATLRDQGVERIDFVVSGDAAVLLPAHLRKLPAGTVNRLLIHSSPTVARGVRLALAAPVLGVAYGQQADAEQRQEPDELAGDAERWSVRRRGPAFLTELEIPALLARWMDGSL